MPKGSHRLSDADALVHRIESDPILRSPILVVALLDRRPRWATVHKVVGAATTTIPHLRERLVAGGAMHRRIHWEEDADFSLDHHLRRLRVAGGGVETALALAEPDVMADFDVARPLWTLTVVEGLDEGRAALVLRFHHSITDGVGGVDLAGRLFTTTRRGPADDAASTGSRGPTDRSAAEPTGHAHQRSLGARLVGAAAAPLHPLIAGAGVARSFVKMVAPARALAPLLDGRSLDRRLAVLEVPLADLRGTAHATHATVNDVLLAAVGGGVHRYHEALGHAIGAVRVMVPVNVRTSDDAPGGNHFTPARFVLPIDDPDPVHRIALAGSLVRAMRREPAIHLTPILASAMALLPDPIVRRAFSGMLRSVDLDVVDVPGLRRPASFAGARVSRLWGFAPASGAAMSVTLVSHGDTACIAVASDRAAVTDPELLVACLTDSVQEVIVAGTAASPDGHDHPRTSSRGPR